MRDVHDGGPTQTFEEKLRILSECGFKLSEPFTVDDLLASWGRTEYEQPGFDTVLFGLAMTEEQDPWRSHCINLWHLDTECIDGAGSYVRIATRMTEMAQGSLPLENLRDHVDLESGIAWISFELDGREFKFDLAVDDDWIDVTVLSKLDKLLQERDSSKTYVHYDLGGQDCILGCLTRESFERLKGHGVKFLPGV